MYLLFCTFEEFTNVFSIFSLDSGICRKLRVKEFLKISLTTLRKYNAHCYNLWSQILLINAHINITSKLHGCSNWYEAAIFVLPTMIFSKYREKGFTKIFQLLVCLIKIKIDVENSSSILLYTIN